MSGRGASGKAHNADMSASIDCRLRESFKGYSGYALMCVSSAGNLPST